jgi:hypothetical protein
MVTVKAEEGEKNKLSFCSRCMVRIHLRKVDCREFHHILLSGGRLGI